MKPVRIAAAQTVEFREDIEAALKYASDVAACAEAEGASLLCFPEGFLQGYLTDEAPARRNALDLASPAFAAVLTIFLAQSDPHFHNRTVAAISVFFIGTALSYGAIAQFDVLADRSAPITYQTNVLGKRADNGRTTTYYLRVAPWGSRQDAQEIAVPLALYRIIRPGQPVDIHLFSGALHLPWYSLSPGATSAADR